MAWWSFLPIKSTSEFFRFFLNYGPKPELWSRAMSRAEVLKNGTGLGPCGPRSTGPWALLALRYAGRLMGSSYCTRAQMTVRREAKKPERISNTSKSTPHSTVLHIDCLLEYDRSTLTVCSKAKKPERSSNISKSVPHVPKAIRISIAALQSSSLKTENYQICCLCKGLCIESASPIHIKMLQTTAKGTSVPCVSAQAGFSTNDTTEVVVCSLEILHVTRRSQSDCVHMLLCHGCSQNGCSTIDSYCFGSQQNFTTLQSETISNRQSAHGLIMHPETSETQYSIA